MAYDNRKTSVMSCKDKFGATIFAIYDDGTVFTKGVEFKDGSKLQSAAGGSQTAIDSGTF